jgi:hypothetical protein
MKDSGSTLDHNIENTLELNPKASDCGDSSDIEEIKDLLSLPVDNGVVILDSVEKERFDDLCCLKRQIDRLFTNKRNLQPNQLPELNEETRRFISKINKLTRKIKEDRYGINN